MPPTTIATFFFDPQHLTSLARYRQGYGEALPFPHAVFDDFLPVEALDTILEEFPGPEDIPWRRHYHGHSRKLACNDETLMGPFTRHLFSQFNSATFVRFLEELTGIEGLIPDPHLEGGGLHQIERGGRLDIHADFNLHDRMRLDRRLNLLLFLNRDWEETYSGHLELWNREMTRCEKRILPVFNRCVVFSTTDWSFHGHPQPLDCPQGVTRKSLALYYYSNGRPEEERSVRHSTLYQARSDASSVAGRVGGLRRILAALRAPR